MVNRLDRSDVVDDIRSTLGRGSLVALELDYQIDLFHRFYRMGPGTRGLLLESDRATAEWASRRDAANAVVFSVFASVRSIIIEDGSALGVDSVRPGCAFVDDRVLQWRSVRPEPFTAAEYLRVGAHGVPLCAYLSTLEPGDIGLRAGSNLESHVVGRLANSTVAVAIPCPADDSYVLACRLEPDLTASRGRWVASGSVVSAPWDSNPEPMDEELRDWW